MEPVDSEPRAPAVMRAAVYRGNSTIEIEEVPVPEIGPGELLVRVEACGICHTDLKKVEHNLLAPPRIFGHETAGVVVKTGAGVQRHRPGDRVIAFHHVPCGECFYCQRGLYAQCPVYKQVGITAGFEAAGGGFSEYVRVMPWIAERGVERFEDDVPFARACLVEPVNTCHKGITLADPQPDETVVIQGQGPIGLIFTMLARRTGARILATDAICRRRELACRFGAEAAWDPRTNDVESEVKKRTEGRGADVVIVAVSAPGIVEQAMRCSRPGSRILLFAQTSHQERVELSGADICVGERTLFGCYSASVDLQKESARLVFSGELPVDDLVSHRLPLDQIRHGIKLAQHPDAQSLKIIVEPQQRWAQ